MENISIGNITTNFNTIQNNLCLGTNIDRLALKINCDEMLMKTEVLQQFMLIVSSIGFSNIIFSYKQLSHDCGYSMHEKKRILDFANKHSITLSYAIKNNDLLISDDIYYSYDFMQYYLNIDLSCNMSVFCTLPKVINISKRYLSYDETHAKNKLHDFGISSEFLMFLQACKTHQYNLKSVLFDDIIYSDIDSETLHELQHFCVKMCTDYNRKFKDFTYLYKAEIMFFNALKDKIILELFLRSNMINDISESNKKTLITLQRNCLSNINKFYKALINLCEVEYKDFCLIHIDYTFGGLLNRIKSVVKRLASGSQNNSSEALIYSLNSWQKLQ